MKNPLSYQATEYDCGPTSMINGISFLFEREEIPPDVIKYITLYCLDSYNQKGEFGKKGTSSMAMMFLSNWLNQFGKVKKFPVYSEFVSGEEVHISQNSRIAAGLQQGGAVVVRLMYGCWHYALLTGIEDTNVYLFDPYFRKRPFQLDGVSIVQGEPARHNRKVSFQVLNDIGKKPYAMGPLETREAIILFNEKTRKTAGNTIEYFI
jgi:hypothetical protein